MNYNILTIEREYGSGGREIGKLVSERLGIPFYGEEILILAAERYGTSPEYLQSLEEKATNSFLYALYLMSQDMTAQGMLMTDTGLSREDSLTLAESKIIEELACVNPVVFIGHCAGYTLRERDDVLNVFIHSDKEKRKQRAIEEYGISPQKAEHTLKKFDHKRSNYYLANTNEKWNRAANYHMTLDSGKLGSEKCASILIGAMGR